MSDALITVQVTAPGGAVSAELEGVPGLTLGERKACRSKTPLADGMFIEWIVVAVVGSVATIVNRLLRLKDRQDEKGVLLDLGADPPRVSFVENIPYGTLVVRQPGVAPQVHKLADKPAADWEALFGLVGKFSGS